MILLLLLVNQVRKSWETLRSKGPQGPLPIAHDLPSVCVARRISPRGYCPSLRPPFLERVVRTRSPRAPVPPPCALALGGHLPGSALHRSPLRRLHRRELRGWGEGAADPGAGDAAAAKKTGGASAANCPEPEGALQGLRAREVTFPGRGGGSCFPAQLWIQENRSGPQEGRFQLSRLPPSCLKGRLPTYRCAYW